MPARSALARTAPCRLAVYIRGAAALGALFKSAATAEINQSDGRTIGPMRERQPDGFSSETTERDVPKDRYVIIPSVRCNSCNVVLKSFVEEPSEIARVRVAAAVPPICCDLSLYKQTQDR